MVDDIERLTERGFIFLYSKISKTNCLTVTDEQKQEVIDFLNQPPISKGERLNLLVNSNCSRSDQEKMEKIGTIYFEEKDSDYRVEKLANIYDFFDMQQGHLLSSYYQNMLCLLEYIDNTVNTEKLLSIYKAQLTSAEIQMPFYFIMGYSGPSELKPLLIKLNIFKNLKASKIIYFCGRGIYQNDLEKRKEKGLISNQQ